MEPLAIQRFLATPERVDVSGKATLLWSVEGAESVSIDQGIGEVEPQGTLQVTPGTTTTYTLTAAGGTSTATATVRIMVGKPSANNPSPSPGPGPSPKPSPSGSPSPSPSPSGSPSPAPSPSPSARPSPSPSPSPSPTTPSLTPNSCGAPAPAPDACGLTIEQTSPQAAGACAQLTRLSVIPACPVAVGMTRTIMFDVTADSPQALTWRRVAAGADAVSPGSGSLLARGKSSVTTTAVVYDTALGFEVVDAGGRVLLRFTMQHR
ncbi:MAG TPA: hypothetical protein VFO85_08435 [Vicinamibacteria bacterium]|nr:hypothetical protein [Vicinamibacteria bacterium]